MERRKNQLHAPDPVRLTSSRLATAARFKDEKPEDYQRALAAFHEAKMHEAIGLAITYAGGDRERVAAVALGDV